MGVNQRQNIVMTDVEITEFIRRSRTLVLASTNAAGAVHLVPMWFGIVDGMICFETKAKSQKVVNFRRDDRASVLIEAGDVYGELRGVSQEGTVELVDDPAFLWKVGLSVWERYTGPYTANDTQALETMLNKRIAGIFHPVRTRSWDHRKLALPPSSPAGDTSQYLPSAKVGTP